MGSCAAPSAKGDDKFITTDYLQQCQENWAAPDEAERAFAVLFNVLGIEAPDRERLAFYLRLDPLTWG
ncbi:hypothetical protein HL496_01580 [Escherichia coli]|nr:hypothetical protein [Escherichia coli]